MASEKIRKKAVFVFGKSSKKEHRRTGLNFGRRTRRDAVLVVL